MEVSVNKGLFQGCCPKCDAPTLGSYDCDFPYVVMKCVNCNCRNDYEYYGEILIHLEEIGADDG